VSNASLTPTGGWYADPMDAAQLRWWDGVNWTQQTTPASDAEPLAPVTPIAPEAPAPAHPPAPAAPAADGPGIYIPRNSVFKMAEAVDGQTYLPEWSGLADISDEVALSGVPVQLALTATPSEGPPIPVSADAFPILGFTPEPVAAEPAAPAWQVEQPLATPIDQLFPVAGPPAAAAAAPTPAPAPAPAPINAVAAFPIAAPTLVTSAPVASAPAADAPVQASSFPLPVPPVPATIPVPAPAAAFSIAVAHAPTDVDASPSLSPDIFPTAAPASALTVAPPPTGALFPGLVPDAEEPSIEPDAAPPVSIPVLAAVPDLIEPAEAAAPVAAPVAEAPIAEVPVFEIPVVEAPVVEAPVVEAPVAIAAPVAEAPVIQAPAIAAPVSPEPIGLESVVAPQVVAPQVAAPQPELYAGPTVAATPVPMPFDAPAPPLAAPAPVTDAPGVGYEPLVARAIPQPVLLAAPVETPAAVAESTAEPVAPSMAPASAPFAAAPAEPAWPADGTYQPHPGVYVPFDPNAVVVEERVPVIPFSSRDPFNPASTSRPALRSYGAAPVGPSGSTFTPALAIILLTPLLIAAGYALLFQLATINVGLAPNIALAALLGALFFVGIGAAQFDRNSLARRGYFDLASPFWILLSPLVYLGVRASRLHSQGSGGIRAVFLWFVAWAGAAAILAFSTFAALTAVTPDRIAQTEQAIAQSYTVDKVVPKVDCPSVPSFASGTVFNCTATAGSTVQLVQVTITNWTGTEAYTVVPTTTTPAATAP
jgi:hypothetical protein